MNKLVEKFKTIVPRTRIKILFVIALFFACSLLAFTFVNVFNLPNALLTILASFGCGAVLCATHRTALHSVLPGQQFFF